VAAARRSRKVGAGVVVLLALVVTVLALATGQRRVTPGIGSGCLVRDRSFVVPLTTDQAGLAATIAGVARDRSMPVRAVTIAYAAALQESGLANLAYGDRDSVGIFQQRPSQGWGPRRLLLDPVYASTRFFRALARVPGYRHLLVYQAAQAVQHSADGYAYSQYSGQGAAMAAGFTGQLPHAVWCWYQGDSIRHSRLAAARLQLTRTFGHLSVVGAGDPALRVRVRLVPTGWSVAAWLVTHAAAFGITSVGYDGYAWTAKHSVRGWQHARDRGRASAQLDVTFG
jgi:hypothetical protein